jgi:hypothetical protein
MATRNVVVASAASNTAKKFTTTATTWGELKAQSDMRGLIAGEVEAIINPGKQTLGRDESVLPTEDFSLFLIPLKNKAGSDYVELARAISDAIRKAASIAAEDDVDQLKEDLIEVIADHFGVTPEQIGAGPSDRELSSALREASKLARG